MRKKGAAGMLADMIRNLNERMQSRMPRNLIRPAMIETVNGCATFRQYEARRAIGVGGNIPRRDYAFGQPSCAQAIRIAIEHSKMRHEQS
jgi:hypothetical protein